MQSVVSQVESFIKTHSRGKLFLAQDFYHIGSDGAIRITLMRLVKKDLLIRVAQGIYLYPKTDEKLGLGVLYPSMDAIAKVIAKRDKARIVPTGNYALHALGLSTQVPVNVVYLTDGAPRKINIYNHKILFKHTAPKNLAYKCDVLMLIVSALKERGKDNVTKEDLIVIRKALEQDNKEKIFSDLILAPAWIRKIITSLI